jgi:hypothetical protein
MVKVVLRIVRQLGRDRPAPGHPPAAWTQQREEARAEGIPQVPVGRDEVVVYLYLHSPGHIVLYRDAVHAGRGRVAELQPEPQFLSGGKLGQQEPEAGLARLCFLCQKGMWRQELGRHSLAVFGYQNSARRLPTLRAGDQSNQRAMLPCMSASANHELHRCHLSILPLTDSDPGTPWYRGSGRSIKHEPITVYEPAARG